MIITRTTIIDILEIKYSLSSKELMGLTCAMKKFIIPPSILQHAGNNAYTRLFNCVYLTGMFQWDKTIEGVRYWSTIDDRWWSGVKIQTLKINIWKLQQMR